MKRLIFVMVIAFGIAQIYASEPESKNNKPVQSNCIKGTITDHLTGEALVGVSLKLNGSDKKVYTDLQGVFRIDSIPTGNYDIDIQYVSYKQVTLKDVSSSAIETTLKVELESSATSF